MKRAAIFAEGATEIEFIRQLVGEILGHKNLQIRTEKWHGKKFLEISLENQKIEAEFFLLLIDCQGDKAVKSAILERRNNLLGNNYSLIVGLRDVRPDFTRTEIDRLRQGLSYRLPQAGLPTHICLAIMEIESWFIQEVSHFSRIDSTLTLDHILSTRLFNPYTGRAEDIDDPADILNRIYKSAGKSYSKNKKRVSRTISSLDFAEIYISNRALCPSMDEFLGHIDAFLDS